MENMNITMKENLENFNYKQDLEITLKNFVIT